MSILSFIKEAGEKLLGHAAAKPAEIVADPNLVAAEAISHYVQTMGLVVSDLHVVFDGATGTVKVTGVAATQAKKEKIILCCGNVHGVASVEDDLTVKEAAPESKWHTVEKGDTLWKIAERAYGKGSEYNRIFEANRPMLSHPDKIYPGQKLRIPA